MSDDMFPFEEEGYYYHHKVETQLAMIVVDVADPTKSLIALSRDDDGNFKLPSQPLKRGGSLYDGAREIFTRLTGSSPDFSPLLQVGVYDYLQPDTVVIIYSSMLQLVVPIISPTAEWIPLSSLPEKFLALVANICNYHKVKNHEV